VGYTVEVAEADAYADGLTWSNLAARTATTDQTTVSDDLSTNALSSDYRFYRVKRDDGSEYSWQTAAVFELHLAVGFATRQFFVSTPLIPDTDHVGVEDVLGTQLDYAGVRMDKLIADSGLYSSATYDDVADTWTGGYSIVAGEGYWLKVGNAYPIPHTVRLTGYVPEETLRVSVARDSWAVSHRWIGYSMPRPTTLGALGLEAEVVPFWSSEVRLLPLGATAWNSYRWDGAKWYDVTNPGVDAGGTPIACGEGILFIHNAIAGEDDTLVWPTWYLHPPNTW
jgi:hypothetical protein